MPNAQASQRRSREITWIIGLWLALLLLVALDLASGGRPDPPALRAAAMLLDGPWHFRMGDDPRWASPTTDVRHWETLDLTAAPGSHDGDVGLPDYVAGWMAHGHAGGHGYAWYRRAVTVPATPAHWSVLGPTLVEDGYELYWNGRLLGGSGQLGASPRLVGTRPLRFALPDDAPGSRGVLALRVYMAPGSAASPEGGGMHAAPILAPRAVADALHHVQWQRTIAGYVVDAVEPLTMLALAGLALYWRRRSSRPGFLAMTAIALLLTALRRLNNAIVSWTDLQSLATYTWLASAMWLPTLGAWLLAWNRWRLETWRSVDVLAIGVLVLGGIGIAWPAPILVSGCRWLAIVLFALLALRILRSGPSRPLALATLAALAATQFGRELLDPLGVPGIWFPFNIGVARTQYLYAAAIPLLGCLLVTSLDPGAAGRMPSARRRSEPAPV
jgi:hypothetical protein